MPKKTLKAKKIDEIVEDISKEVEESGDKLELIEEQVLDSGKDVDEIKEQVIDAGKDFDEIKEDVDDIKEDVDDIKEDLDKIQKGQESILAKVRAKIVPDKFAFDDLAQQIVGALILSAPLAVTEEVWMLAFALDIYRVIVILAITLTFDILLIYFTKYQEVESQKIFNIVPTRLLSLIIVSYSTAALILFIFGVIGGQVTSLGWALRLVLFVGLFANIGAGTADMLK